MFEFYSKIYDAEVWMHEKFAQLSDDCSLNLNSINLMTDLSEFENKITKLKNKLLIVFSSRNDFFKINEVFYSFLERWIYLKYFLEKYESLFYTDALIKIKILLCTF